MEKAEANSENSETTSTKDCVHCFQAIDSRASVCDKCGRHQGAVGWFASIAAIVSVVVAILGVSFTAFNAFRTELDRLAVHNALQIAQRTEQEVKEALEIALQTEHSLKFSVINREGNHIWELGWNGIGCGSTEDVERCKTYVKRVYDALAILLFTLDQYPGDVPEGALDMICAGNQLNAMRPEWLLNARRYPELREDLEQIRVVGASVCSGRYSKRAAEKNQLQP